MGRRELFRQHRLEDLLNRYIDEVKNEIQGYDLDHISINSEDDICQNLLNRYCLVPPELVEDTIHRSPHSSRGKGISIEFSISFTGNSTLFDYYTIDDRGGAIYGDVVEQKLCLTYSNIPPETLKQLLERELARIKTQLRRIKERVKSFNDSFQRLIKEQLAETKQRLIEHQEAVDKLEIPIRRYDEIPKAYEVPDATKELEFEEAETTDESNSVELRRLRGNTYEDILEITYSMSRAMERSSRVFYGLKEPEIRDFFLVFLNGHYGWIGHASGETFNRAGHADIIINFEGMNIFVAECKFWGGEKKLLKTIDQLFRYVTWRDTKTAILLFSRNESFSGVLRQIDDIMTSHKCWRQSYQLKSANLQEFADLAAPEDRTIFSYKFCLPGDKDRELFLTVMAFDIPNKQKGAAPELIEEIGQLSTGGNSVEDIKRDRER